jgi:hypothetical protein
VPDNLRKSLAQDLAYLQKELSAAPLAGADPETIAEAEQTVAECARALERLNTPPA